MNMYSFLYLIDVIKITIY